MDYLIPFSARAQWAQMKGLLGQLENLIGWQSQGKNTEYYAAYKRLVANAALFMKFKGLRLAMDRSLVNGFDEQCLDLYRQKWIEILDEVYPRAAKP